MKYQFLYWSYFIIFNYYKIFYDIQITYNKFSKIIIELKRLYNKSSKINFSSNYFKFKEYKIKSVKILCSSKNVK